MNEPKCKPEDYIQFLIASQGRYSCAEAERVQPQTAERPAHDSFRDTVRWLAATGAISAKQAGTAA